MRVIPKESETTARQSVSFSVLVWKRRKWWIKKRTSTRSSSKEQPTANWQSNCRIIKNGSNPIEIISPLLLTDFPVFLRLKNPEDFESLQRLTSLFKRKGYSPKTEKAYVGHAKRFRFLAQLKVPFVEVTPGLVQEYVQKLLSRVVMKFGEYVV
jgi:hypothetical protein